MIEIDGSCYSGSGTIVRQAVVLSALTGQPVHIRNARAHRAKPGLQPQHIRVVEAIRELVDGRTEGISRGSQELSFWPGRVRAGATLDRFAADQVIPFAALGEGESRFRIPEWSDHIQSNAWLVREFPDHVGSWCRLPGRFPCIVIYVTCVRSWGSLNVDRWQCPCIRPRWTKLLAIDQK
jgi:RNA 3'-terminal phosphate cyclase